MLSVKNISKKYRHGKSDFFALKQTSFVLPEKGMVAIYGKSGSGKTTLLNLLSGLDVPSRGNVFYRKRVIDSATKTDYLRRRVGFVFQHYNLIEKMSVFDNVALSMKIGGGPGGKKRVYELLRKVGLGGFASRNVDTLSGGEKQRVAICRALAKDPDIIFADEPTGALDEKNAHAIMELLSRAAKNRLVVFVSHNQTFVEEYGQTRLHVRDGVVEEVSSLKSGKRKEKHTKRNGKPWLFPFLKRNLIRNKAKNALCIFAGTLGFASLLLSIGFFAGSEVALEKEGYKILGSQVAYLSEEERVEVPSSPLTLLRQKRPALTTALDALEGLGNISLETDYSSFLPESIGYSLGGTKMDPVRFFPFYDLSLTEGNFKMLVEGVPGEKTSFQKVLVNTEFVSFCPGGAIGERISLSHELDIRTEAGQEHVVLEYDFEIVGVVKELSFMGEPRIYYSYPGLQDYLSSIELNGSGSLLDFIAEQGEDSPYLHYRYLLFAHDLPSVKNLYCKIEALEGSSMSIDSEAYQVRLALKTLMEAFESSLLLVVGFSFSGLAAILAMVAFSHYASRRKEIAVLMSLGARRKEIVLLYAFESGLVSFASAVLGLALSYPFGHLASSYLETRFGFASIIDVPYESLWGIPYLLLWGIPSIALLSGFLFGSLPIIFSKAIPLAEELRDE